MNCKKNSTTLCSLACPAAPPEPLSVKVCAGSYQVALYPNNPMPRVEALAFCKAQLGEDATLVRASPAIMAVAQDIVKRANVGASDG